MRDGRDGWNWRCPNTSEPFLSPRDWSPKVAQAVRDLKAKEALLPKDMILSGEGLEEAPPVVKDPVRAGTAFVLKFMNTHEVIWVSPKGNILMSPWLEAVFDGYYGTVEEGLAAKMQYEQQGGFRYEEARKKLREIQNRLKARMD